MDTPPEVSRERDVSPRPRRASPRGAMIVTTVAIAAALFVWIRRGDIAATARVLSQLRLGPLALAVGLSAVAIINRGALNRASHRAVGLTADLRSMTRVSAAAYALNKVVKTGGVAGIALFVRHGGTENQPAGQVTAAYVLASLCAQLALLGLVLAVIGGAALVGALTGAVLAGAIAFAITATVALVLVVAAVRTRETVHRLSGLPHRVLATCARAVGRPAPKAPNPRHADHFYNAAETLRRAPRDALPVLGHAIAAKVLGAGVLAASLAATGAGISIASAIAAYAIALMAAMVGVVPGGLGVVESSLAALLGAFGIAAPVAIAAVLTFRLLDLWLPLGVGLLSARSLTRTAVDPLLPCERHHGPLALATPIGP